MHSGSAWLCFLLVLMVIIYNFIWLLFRLFRPLYPEYFDGANFWYFCNLNSSFHTTPSLLHAGARPKQKITVALAPQQQPREQAALGRCLYHMPLGTTITNKLPLKWAANEEVLCWLKGKVKPLPSIKPRKPSQIDDLVSTFSNTFDAPPSPETYTWTKLENHHWWLPCHYIQMVKNGESNLHSKKFNSIKILSLGLRKKACILLRHIPTGILQELWLQKTPEDSTNL